ncbi:MAG TPA: NifU family protein [Bacteroidota bacterium]|nr:NifU family protein [Bacteroidota bacterium]
MTEQKTETGVEERIERALDICRPYLHADGGDVEIVSVREGGVVELHFRGTCAVCPMSGLTLRAGIERAILRFVPEIRRVESV